MNNTMEKQNRNGLEHYLSPVHVWALSFGCAVGWGSFIMPGTIFLPKAGPVGTFIGLIAGAVVMFIIGINYHYLMNKYTDAGGTLTYTIKTFGYDHGFMSAWFLILVYIAIIWANASAFGLISKNLFGTTFQFGFYYQILGYDVYFGEVLLSMVAIFICGMICIKGKKLAAGLQVIFAVILILGIVTVAVYLLAHKNGGMHIPKPLFSQTTNEMPLRQVFTIMALSPWAYVGFESISNSAAGFKFSPKKSIWIMTAALFTSVIAYALLSQIAIARIPDVYGNWQQYIGDLGSFRGIEGIPTFNAARMGMGERGVFILGFAAFAALATGIIGNFIAASRLLFIMAEDGMLPEWFGRLNKDKTPQNALMLLTGISMLVPFLGRTAIGWIVDVNTIGATIAYAYTSADAFANAQKDNNKLVRVTGIIGILMSGFFAFYFMLWSAEAMSTESYLILASWSILGFFYFRFVFEKDEKKRFGKSTIVWITLLFLIFFTSVMWVKKSTDDMTIETINNISSYYMEKNQGEDPEVLLETEIYVQGQITSVDKRLTRNIVIQMILNAISLSIMFSIYSIMSKREKQAQVETIKARERSRAKTIFLSNMSHDIRTPMNAIIGYINLAEDEEVTFEELKGYLQKIKGSSNHLLALINDVLEMSRIESGKMELEPVPVNLKGVLADIKDLFETQMSEKKIDYSVDYSAINDTFVYCDKNRLNRVLLNLVSNAYKFTCEGGTVRVVAKQLAGGEGGKNKYEMRVSDSGVGMSEEFAKKVFEPFEREKDAEASEVQGTGLGMAIVKSIVEMMGGKITVKSKKGVGTEFVVTIDLLPLSEEDILKQKVDSLDNKERTVSFEGKRLLLADDILVNRQIAKRILEKSGFAVEEAEDGQDCVNKLSGCTDGYYDAVLMDIQMPGLNGYEATARIREMEDEYKRNIPIIAMTANAFSEDIKAALDAGMTAHVAKPIDVKKLMEVLSEVLG